MSALRERYRFCTVDFFKLSEPVQRRFIECIAQRGTPLPLVSDAAAAPGSVALWVLVAIVAAGGAAGLWALNFGVIVPGQPAQPAAFVAAYAALAVVFLFAVASLIRRIRVRGKLPFSPGMHLFPVDLVDARSEHLRLYPLKGLRDIVVRKGGRGEHEVALTYADGSSHVLRAASLDPELASEVHATKARIEEAIQASDAKILEPLDVFFEDRSTDDWKAALHEGTPAPPRRAQPWLGWAVPLIAALGLPAGWGLYRARNDASDRAGIQAAAKRDDADLLRAYIAQGGRLSAEADGAWLDVARRSGATAPIIDYMRSGGALRGEADDALFNTAVEISRREGTMDALTKYIAEGEKHDSEADDAMLELAKKSGRSDVLNQYLKVGGGRHAAEVKSSLLPRALLAEAKRERKPDAIRAFIKSYPDPPLRDEGLAALKEQFQAIRADYKARAGDAKYAATIDALLAHLETHDEPLRVRLRQAATEELRDEDKKRAEDLGGEYTPATPYFHGGTTVDSRTNLLKNRVELLLGELSLGVIPVEGHLGGGKVEPPVLDTYCEFAPSKDIDRYEIDGRIFMAVEASCSVSLIVPGQKTPAAFTTTFKPDRISSRTLGGADVYDGMFDRLFNVIYERLEERLIAKR